MSLDFQIVLSKLPNKEIEPPFCRTHHVLTLCFNRCHFNLCFSLNEIWFIKRVQCTLYYYFTRKKDGKRLYAIVGRRGRAGGGEEGVENKKYYFYLCSNVRSAISTVVICRRYAKSVINLLKVRINLFISYK